VEEIISYIDYKKYHTIYLNDVLEDITRTSNEVDEKVITPSIAYEILGLGKERREFVEGMILGLLED
jgi:hypothetical protein